MKYWSDGDLRFLPLAPFRALPEYRGVQGEGSKIKRCTADGGEHAATGYSTHKPFAFESP